MLEDMKRARGFTLIELLVTITIMVILMTLAVTNFRSTQALARDEERKTDVQSIVQTLDNLYSTGYVFTDATMNFKGSYPSIAMMTDVSLRNQIFKELPIGSRNAPSNTVSPDSILTVAAGSPTASPTPAATITTYVYQPLKSDGTHCALVTDECRKFVIRYSLEGSGITTIMSKNQ